MWANIIAGEAIANVPGKVSKSIATTMNIEDIWNQLLKCNTISRFLPINAMNKVNKNGK